MSTITTREPLTTADDSPPFPVHRWTVEEYERFAKLGFLDEDDNLELIEGWIVKKMTKNPRHDSTVDRIVLRLNKVLPPNWYVRSQNVLLTPDSAPEPDVVIVRGQPEDYLDRHPGPADVALVIEVADSSLARDRLKRRMYARAGIPTYWIVNLIDSVWEVYTRPDGSTASYLEEQILSRAGKVTLVIPQLEPFSIPVAELVR